MGAERVAAQGRSTLSSRLVAVALVWGCQRPRRRLEAAALGLVCPCAQALPEF